MQWTPAVTKETFSEMGKVIFLQPHKTDYTMHVGEFLQVC